MPRLITADEWEPRGVTRLEKNAERVVRSDKNTVVTAGPGAGKTELLAQRASFLLETGACPHPKRILAISFKRDAAENLRERVLQRSGSELGRRFDSFTFDAFSKGMLDQFLGLVPSNLRPSSDYEVLTSLSKAEVKEVLSSMVPPIELGTLRDLTALASKDFFSKKVPRTSFCQEPSTLREWGAQEFWKVLIRRQPSELSFPMIARLAGRLIKADRRIARAYRATYSHVFLDEFQDTTDLQYWLTRMLFAETDAILTAVGDPRQRIMGWAFALKGIFAKYETDFRAERFELVRNYRSSPQIAPVVRYIAEQLGDSAVASVPGPGPPANSCAAHTFVDDVAEADWIAAEIDSLVSSGIKPRDIAVLVRMQANKYGARTIEALHSKGRRARVEDGIQQLLSQPIVDACVLALQALALKSPGPSWAEFRDFVADCRGTGDSRSGWLLDEELRAARESIRTRHPIPPSDSEEVATILSTLIEPFVNQVRQRHPQYRRGSFYARTVRQFGVAVATAATTSRTWQSVLNQVQGVDTVPVLTIHKSKGLEYHSVFFLGLEDRAFWNFKRQPSEESKAFFVGVSRAKQRLVFSFAKQRVRDGHREFQSEHNIKKLYELMKAAGVQRVVHP